MSARKGENDDHFRESDHRYGSILSKMNEEWAENGYRELEQPY